MQKDGAFSKLQRNRKRIGPFAVEASTTWPCCVISMLPCATSRLAAARLGSISPSHFSRSSLPATARAASLGQMVFPAPRSRSSRRISRSNCSSIGCTRCRRQASEQNLTSSQFLAQLLRHSITRPHAAHVLAVRSGVVVSCFALRSGMRPRFSPPHNLLLHIPAL